MKAVNEDIIVREARNETKNKSGLILVSDDPDTMVGCVIAAGSKQDEIVPGDYILVARKYGWEFKYLEDDYYKVKMDHVIAILPDFVENA